MALSQICSRCCAARKGHALPVGANCTLRILTDGERQKVIDSLENKGSGSDNHDHSDIETSPIRNKDGELDIDAELVRLQAEKVRLEKEKANTQKAVKESLDKEKLLQLEALKAMTEKLQNDVENEQSKLVTSQTNAQSLQEQRQNATTNQRTSLPGAQAARLQTRHSQAWPPEQLLQAHHQPACPQPRLEYITRACSPLVSPSPRSAQ